MAGVIGPVQPSEQQIADWAEIERVRATMKQLAADGMPPDEIVAAIRARRRMRAPDLSPFGAGPSPFTSRPTMIGTLPVPFPTSMVAPLYDGTPSGLAIIMLDVMRGDGDQ